MGKTVIQSGAIVKRAPTNPHHIANKAYVDAKVSAHADNPAIHVPPENIANKVLVSVLGNSTAPRWIELGNSLSVDSGKLECIGSMSPQGSPLPGTGGNEPIGAFEETSIVGDGETRIFTVYHSLGYRFIQATVYNSDGWLGIAATQCVDNRTARIVFDEPPEDGETFYLVLSGGNAQYVREEYEVVGDGHSTTFFVNHSLGTRFIQTAVYDENGWSGLVATQCVDSSQIRIEFGNPLEVGEKVYVVLKR